eukprot:scaffold48631_cov57-Attheya_sp.AAC.4
MANETGEADGGDRTGALTHTDNHGWISPLVPHALDRHPVFHEARQHPPSLSIAPLSWIRLLLRQWLAGIQVLRGKWYKSLLWAMSTSSPWTQNKIGGTNQELESPR